MKPFPWRRGMRDTTGLRVLEVGDDGLPSVWAVELYGEPRIIRRTETIGDAWSRARPDENDGPTRGGFLEAVREAFDAPAAIVIPWTKWDPVAKRAVILGWHVYLNDAGNRKFPPDEPSSSEFAALEAAWKVAP